MWATAIGVTVAGYDNWQVFLLALTGGATMALGALIVGATGHLGGKVERAREYAEATMHLQVSQRPWWPPRPPEPRGPGPEGPIRSRRVVYRDGIPMIVGVSEGTTLDATRVRSALERREAT